MRALLTISAALLGALLLTLPGRAHVPLPERIAAAVAAANRSAGRLRVLEVDVALYLGASEQPAATGELRSDPGGLSRLELRSPGGVVERHLLRGSELLASRDGLPVDAPRPFLLPFFLLQAGSSDVLRSSLLTLGVLVHQVDLGYQDEHDCYVLGGRAPSSGTAVPPSRPALWVDQESLEVVRFDRGDGVRFRLGAPASFGSLRLPSWIEIRDSRGFLARLEILNAEEASSSPGSFRPAWLSAP
jgi:hypothetical protein